MVSWGSQCKPLVVGTLVWEGEVLDSNLTFVAHLLCLEGSFLLLGMASQDPVTFFLSAVYLQTSAVLSGSGRGPLTLLKLAGLPHPPFQKEHTPCFLPESGPGRSGLQRGQERGQSQPLKLPAVSAGWLPVTIGLKIQRGVCPGTRSLT